MTKPKTHKKKPVFRKNKKGVSRRIKYQTGGAPLTPEQIREIHEIVTGIYNQLGGHSAAATAATAVFLSTAAPETTKVASAAVSAAIQQFMSGLGGAMGEDIRTNTTGLIRNVPRALLSTYQVIYDALTACPYATVAIVSGVGTGITVYKYHAQIVERLGQLRAEAGAVGGNIRDDPLYLLTYIISLLYCIQQEITGPAVAVARATAEYITHSTLSAAYQLSAVASVLARGASNVTSGFFGFVSGLSSSATNTASNIRQRVVSGGQLLLGVLDTVSTMGASCIMPGAAAAPAPEPELNLNPSQMNEMIGSIITNHPDIYSRNINDAQQIINAQWIARVRSTPRLDPDAARQEKADALRSSRKRREQLFEHDSAAAAASSDRTRKRGLDDEKVDNTTFPFGVNAESMIPFDFLSNTSSNPYGAPPSVPAPQSADNINKKQKKEGGKYKKRDRSHKKHI